MSAVLFSSFQTSRAVLIYYVVHIITFEVFLLLLCFPHKYAENIKQISISLRDNFIILKAQIAFSCL